MIEFKLFIQPPPHTTPPPFHTANKFKNRVPLPHAKWAPNILSVLPSLHTYTTTIYLHTSIYTYLHAHAHPNTHKHTHAPGADPGFWKGGGAVDRVEGVRGRSPSPARGVRGHAFKITNFEHLESLPEMAFPAF